MGVAGAATEAHAPMPRHQHQLLLIELLERPALPQKHLLVAAIFVGHAIGTGVGQAVAVGTGVGNAIGIGP